MEYMKKLEYSPNLLNYLYTLYTNVMLPLSVCAFISESTSINTVIYCANILNCFSSYSWNKLTVNAPLM